MSETEQPASPSPIVRTEPAEVAAGIFVFPDERVPLVPNVGIVVGEQAVLVIDTGMGLRSAEHVLAHARRLAAGKPLYLTVTHFHPEHGFGAQVFAGQATIIYNESQRDELRRKGAGYIGMFKEIFGPNVAAELEGVELVDPHVVYDGAAEIDLGGHVATAAHLRARAHRRRPGRARRRQRAVRRRSLRDAHVPDRPVLPARRRRRRRQPLDRGAGRAGAH